MTRLIQVLILLLVFSNTSPAAGGMLGNVSQTVAVYNNNIPYTLYVGVGEVPYMFKGVKNPTFKNGVLRVDYGDQPLWVGGTYVLVPPTKKRKK